MPEGQNAKKILYENSGQLNDEVKPKVLVTCINVTAHRNYYNLGPGWLFKP